MLLSHVVAFAFGSTAIGQGLSFERPPIDYHNAEVFDPVSILAEKIRSGDTQLAHDPHFGYLKSVLKALDVPVSSQTLVFSKTSLQLHRISKRSPRSLYFNDDVTVGAQEVFGSNEVAEVDAVGARFPIKGCCIIVTGTVSHVSHVTMLSCYIPTTPSIFEGTGWICQKGATPESWSTLLSRERRFVPDSPGHSGCARLHGTPGNFLDRERTWVVRVLIATRYRTSHPAGDRWLRVPAHRLVE